MSVTTEKEKVNQKAQGRPSSASFIESDSCWSPREQPQVHTPCLPLGCVRWYDYYHIDARPLSGFLVLQNVGSNVRCSFPCTSLWFLARQLFIPFWASYSCAWSRCWTPIDFDRNSLWPQFGSCLWTFNYTLWQKRRSTWDMHKFCTYFQGWAV